MANFGIYDFDEPGTDFGPTPCPFCNGRFAVEVTLRDLNMDDRDGDEKVRACGPCADTLLASGEYA